jgi:predicted acyl esterase
MIVNPLLGRQRQEDVAAMFAQDPNRNAYWDDKRADFSNIRVPAYILGSYSTNLHTLGAFRAFEEITHDKKWYVEARTMLQMQCQHALPTQQVYYPYNTGMV